MKEYKSRKTKVGGVKCQTFSTKMYLSMCIDQKGKQLDYHWKIPKKDSRLNLKLIF